MKSSLSKNLARAFVFSSFFIFASCGNSGQPSDTTTGDSTQTSGTDTTHTGLEGTRDQSSSLSTDVKGDSSSGQHTKIKQMDSTTVKDTLQKK